MTFDKLNKIWSEDRTLDAVIQGRSISRYGEGELRYCVKGWAIKSQLYDPKLATELLNGLKNPGDCLLALPRVWDGMPAERFWRQFERDSYTKYFIHKEYGSAFISRSDMVNNIDRPDYWEKVRSLWLGKDVILAGQSPKILPLDGANSVTFIQGPAIDAYAQIDRIEKEIVESGLGPVFICLGATATVLAIRLANKGIQAIDMGHMGRFMLSEGCYNIPAETLISNKYLEAQQKMHIETSGYGNSGRRSVVAVLEFAQRVKTPRILDYGCGKGTLKEALDKLGCKLDIMQYDPAVKGKEKLPKPSELVVCTEVLEYVEPDKLDKVLKHVYDLCKRAAFIVVTTKNAKPPSYWKGKLEDIGFKIEEQEIIPDSNVKFWCMK